MKRTPLKRKTGLKRTGKLRMRSKKRQKEEDQYNKRVKEWKLEHIICAGCAMRGISPVRRTKHCHHWAGREGALLLKEEWWIPLCATCHSWVHDNSNAARELGLLAPKNL